MFGLVALLQPHARLRLDPQLYPVYFKTQKLLLCGNSQDWGPLILMRTCIPSLAGPIARIPSSPIQPDEAVYQRNRYKG